MKVFAPESMPKLALDKKMIKMTPEEERKHFEEHYTNSLKTRHGLSYLCIKYPNLSVTSAINEYLAEAWIVEQSNLT